MPTRAVLFAVEVGGSLAIAAVLFAGGLIVNRYGVKAEAYIDRATTRHPAAAGRVTPGG